MSPSPFLPPFSPLPLRILCVSVVQCAMRITVLSLNIWNYRGGWRARRERIARLIRDVAPDVVGVQEVRRDPRHAFGVDQAAQLARLTGLHHVYAPAMRYWRW